MSDPSPTLGLKAPADKPKENEPLTIEQLRALLVPDPTGPKPGFRTSELWVLAVIALIGVLNRKLALGLSEAEIMSLAGAAAVYIGARTYAKAG